MSKQAQFRIAITDIDPATGFSEHIGEIDLLSFSEKEIYAMYSGKGLSREKAQSYIKQIRTMLRKSKLAPNSDLELYSQQQATPAKPAQPQVKDTKQEEKEKALIDKFLKKKCGGNSCAPQKPET
ncbi:MAG: hypothetical protein K2X29_10945 [Candidatus Obscuribacterales bacterium]|nr:hypothetical protein [Candidatus Obscuribacterales bacterium]